MARRVRPRSPRLLPAATVFGNNDGAGVSYVIYAYACFLSASPYLDDAMPTTPGASVPCIWNNLPVVIQFKEGWLSVED